VIAVEEGPWGVRSNVIAPGPITGTEGMSRLRVHARPSPESLTPLGREGVVQDIANATIFFFSDAANLITGEALVVDGGNHHLSTSLVPYPEAVLDPEGVQKLFKGKL
jgi:peroxisomal 2,4-dienoyl-CoA reductase